MMGNGNFIITLGFNTLFIENELIVWVKKKIKSEIAKQD